MAALSSVHLSDMWIKNKEKVAPVEKTTVFNGITRK